MPKVWLPTCVTTMKPFSGSARRAVVDLEQLLQVHQRQQLVAQPQHRGVLDALDAVLGIGARAHQFDHRRAAGSQSGRRRLPRSAPRRSPSVSGILMVTEEPSPATDLMSMVPPIWSILVRTTSMPTPRPETEVTAAAVEKPGAKMNLWIWASVIFSSSASVTRPFCDRLGLDPLGVEAAAIVGDADDDVAAFMIGGQTDGALLRLAGGGALGRASPGRDRRSCAPCG